MNSTSLEIFIAYAKKIKGDEKSEAHVFLEHLFQAFGHVNLAESGAVLEDRVWKKGGGTKFADLVWPGRVLIEMKSRGHKLERHYSQIFDYWVHLTPNRPRWVILCNFDEFWVYDFNKQVDEPMEKIALNDLAHRAGALSFLKPSIEEPIFGINRIKVTQEAADKVANVFNSMVDRGIDRDQAQKFVLQCVIAKFSEDLKLLPEELFSRILDECLSSQKPESQAFDLISALFRQMNTEKQAGAGRFKDVKYFNGGLFADVNPVLMTKSELENMYESAKQDWSKVHPAIFGTLFQHSMGNKARHAYGAHYTSEADIMKVVNPTIVRPWRKRIDSAGSMKELLDIRKELLDFRVLDPACGSGNFLYVAFRELKRIETDLILKLRKHYKKGENITRVYLSARQFYGFDTLNFAVELAKVTLLLAKEIGLAEAKASIEEEEGTRGFDFDPALPLDNLDQNIRKADALFTEWPEADAIIGNPPYQSKNKMQEEFGPKYQNELREVFPDMPGRADYCVYFFRKAHDHLRKGGRAGLVGTNTIRENYSREGGLDYIVTNGGTITEAVSTQDWSGDAAVHVSIVNWIKGEEKGIKKLSRQAEDKTWSVSEVPTINATLSTKLDVTQAKRLSASADGLFCAQGQTHGHEGFLLSKAEAEEILAKEPLCREAVFPFLTADELLSEQEGKPTRYVIDFQQRDVFDAQKYKLVFNRVKNTVLQSREEAAREESARNKIALAPNPKAKVNHHHANFLARWWLLSYPRQELMAALAKLKRYIVCGQVTKRPTFEFISTSIHPNAALVVFPFEDDYTFGILQSEMHWAWFTARCSTLEERFRYTSDSVFNSFPWPQAPTVKQICAVADAAVNLRKIRRETMQTNKWSLRDLYRAAEQPGENPVKKAQQIMDVAVKEAYGMKSMKDSLEFLLHLNQQCSEREAVGEIITGPGLPETDGKAVKIVTDDCVQM